MARIRTTAALTAIVVCASGCGSAGFQIREAVGLDKNPPDAFAVLPTRPLEIPRDLSALPPPSPGAASPLEADPRALALTALGGQPTPAARPVASGPIYNPGAPAPLSTTSSAPLYAASPAPPALIPAAAPSGAEAALLNAAGAPAAPAQDLRAGLAADAAAEPEYLLDRWIPALRRMRGEASGEIVEPLAEMRRLGQNAPEAGAVPTTPAVQPLLIPPSAAP